MIPRNYGENTTAECRHDSHEATDKQKRRKYILWVLRFRDEPMTAMEIANELYKIGAIKILDRNSVSPRMTEMCKEGICEPVGKKKCTTTGRMVTAFQIREAM